MGNGIYNCFFVCVSFAEKNATKSGSVMATTLPFTASSATAAPMAIDDIDAVCIISMSVTLDASIVATTYGDGSADLRMIDISPGTLPSKPTIARYL